MRNLSCLKPGASGRVEKIDHMNGMTRRLMDLGFIQGAAVRCLFPAPGASMAAYAVRGTVIALRKKDAERILLREEKHEKE